MKLYVFSAEDLEAQGAPNIVELTRSLTSASEGLGAPNIDLAGTAAGRVTVNLRSLGPTRTMVLLNGHRTSDDVSFIATNALEFRTRYIEFFRPEEFREAAVPKPPAQVQRGGETRGGERSTQRPRVTS